MNFKEADFMILPPLCRAKISQQSDQEIQAQWIRKYGPDWGHMHHYCFGLKALNLAYRDFNNKTKREYFSAQAVNEFSYALDRATPVFQLRPEILIQRGRALMLLRSYDEAKESLEEALEHDPKSVDAWVFLSDLHILIGRKTEALMVLEKAIEVTGSEHRKITTRLEDLRKKPTR